MAFFGLTSYGVSEPIRYFLKSGYEEPKNPPKISDVIIKGNYKRPFAEVIRELDIYSGILDGYAYRSVHRLSKMKTKGFSKSIGPSDMYKSPITQSMIHGWFLNDPELQDATWHKTACHMSKPSSETTRFINKALLADKFVIL